MRSFGGGGSHAFMEHRMEARNFDPPPPGGEPTTPVFGIWLKCCLLRGSFAWHWTLSLILDSCVNKRRMESREGNRTRSAFRGPHPPPPTLSIIPSLPPPRFLPFDSRGRGLPRIWSVSVSFWKKVSGSLAGRRRVAEGGSPDQSPGAPGPWGLEGGRKS